MIRLPCIVTVDVIYYMPDHNDLVNEFIWQTSDEIPEMPRVHRFLNYWHDNIEAIIQQVLVSHSYQASWQKIDWEIKYHV